MKVPWKAILIVFALALFLSNTLAQPADVMKSFVASLEKSGVKIFSETEQLGLPLEILNSTSSGIIILKNQPQNKLYLIQESTGSRYFSVYRIENIYFSESDSSYYADETRLHCDPPGDDLSFNESELETGITLSEILSKRCLEDSEKIYVEKINTAKITETGKILADEISKISKDYSVEVTRLEKYYPIITDLTQPLSIVMEKFSKKPEGAYGLYTVQKDSKNENRLFLIKVSKTGAMFEVEIYSYDPNLKTWKWTVYHTEIIGDFEGSTTIKGPIETATLTPSFVLGLLNGSDAIPLSTDDAVENEYIDKLIIPIKDDLKAIKPRAIEIEVIQNGKTIEKNSEKYSVERNDFVIEFKNMLETNQVYLTASAFNPGKVFTIDNLDKRFNINLVTDQTMVAKMCEKQEDGYFDCLFHFQKINGKALFQNKDLANLSFQYYDGDQTLTPGLTATGKLVFEFTDCTTPPVTAATITSPGPKICLKKIDVKTVQDAKAGTAKRFFQDLFQ